MVLFFFQLKILIVKISLYNKRNTFYSPRMNRFDETFFTRYLPEWAHIKWVIHKHIFVILGEIMLNYFFWVIIPAFFYYNSDFFKSFIPFFVIEILFFVMFFKILYRVFWWYNDVWILTGDGVVQINWQLFDVSSVSVKYGNIEGIELVQSGIIDTTFWKWDLVIQKVWWDDFVLNDAASVSEAITLIDQKSKEEQKIKLDKIKKEHEEEERLAHEKSERERFKEKNFETLFHALSEVVEDYLWKSGYEKQSDKVDTEKENLIKEVKKKWGALDIR